MTRVKIKSDGTSAGSRVSTVDGDQTIPVAYVHWELSANSVSRVVIGMNMSPVSIEGEVSMLRIGNCLIRDKSLIERILNGENI